MMLPSHEVRWFLNGGIDQNKALRAWVESCRPFERIGDFEDAAWKGRLNGMPDVYVLVPGHADIGIKWREDQLQIKGLQCLLGTHTFASGHQGYIERWIKWSYDGPAIKEAFGRWFSSEPNAAPLTIDVFKTRYLRKARLDPQSGKAKEVEIKEHIERGCALEVSDLRVGGASYCSVAFEAFPDDSAMHADFRFFVDSFLNCLTDSELTLSKSMAYPQWLGSLFASDGMAGHNA
jgi:hypothetical protein